ncbi:MAG: hypothetical protein K0S74_893 [Chlamydiales bacterium]|jgi:glycerol-3-phosphate O-acyltransferase|nr:hypothetical protein [Chlamydiales bacterium]
MTSQDLRFYRKLAVAYQEGVVHQKTKDILENFYNSYVEALLKANKYKDSSVEILLTFLDLVLQQLKQPYTFEPYHQQILEEFNYYQFGLNFVRPLVNFTKSTVHHKNLFDQVENQLQCKENVVLFANHQTEVDPQLISLLLEKSHPLLATEMIFIAGNRVTTDPLAVPFSMGRNLICIYSKKHIDNPPELRAEKLAHNQRSLGIMGSLLAEGGKCIYVAPSGGRDRLNPDTGKVEVALFDPSSLEMLYLISTKAKSKTHFYPLVLKTYDILPPPLQVEKDVGESRSVNYAGVQLSICPELNMQSLGQGLDKAEQRQGRAENIWKTICKEYDAIDKVSF